MPLELFATMTPDDLPLLYFNQLLSFLPEDRSARIRKFVHRKNALHSLAGELITRNWLAKKLNITPKQIQIKRDQLGKPTLENSIDLFFNIAHSGKWVVTAFDSNEVGIDIEYMREIDLQIAERFFSKKENEELLKKNPNQRKSFFYDLWTLKESYIKAEGKGLTIPLNSFCFSIDNDGTIHFELLNGNRNKEYHFRKYSVAPQYKCAVCAYTNDFPLSITLLNFDNICEEFLRLSA